jgi:3-oxoacyl-[acyl-carrier protein] reductase
MMNDLLSGRKIFVTGGSRGIGAAIVRECVENGAFVGFNYITSHEKAMREVQGSSGNAVCYKADTRNLQEMDEVLMKFSNMGPSEGIDGLVINAGIYKRSSITELEPEDWERTISTNLTGAYNTIRPALDIMDEGAIVFVSSQLAFRGSSFGADYASSKAGLLGFSRSLSRELAPSIRVNSVAPGFVDTDILSGDSDKKRKERISQVPLERIGSPDDIAKPVVFLLSEMSSYITGATIDINGGLFIH